MEAGTRVRLPPKSPQLASVNERNQELQPDEREAFESLLKEQQAFLASKFG